MILFLPGIAEAAPDLEGSPKQFFNPSTGSVLTEASPGEVVRIAITVSNQGSSPATQVVVQDPLDTAILTDITPRDGGTLSGNVVTWSVGTIPHGAIRTVRVDARIRSPLEATQLVNQGSIQFAQSPTSVLTNDPSQPGVADPTVLAIVSEPDLSACTKSVVGLPEREVVPGQTLHYRIDIPNQGDATAQNVVVTDVLDSHLSFVSTSHGGAYDAGARTLIWELGNIAGGQSVTLDLYVQVAAGLANGTLIENQALVTGSNMDPVWSDDPSVGLPDSPTQVTVMARPSFGTFSKSVVNVDATQPGMVRPGDRLEYTLALTNDGPGAADNTQVRDLLDLSLVSDPTPVTGDFRLEGAELVFDADTVPAFASLGAGESVTLRFQVTVAPDVNDGTAIINQAVVNAVDLASPLLSDGNPGSPQARNPTRIDVRYPILRLEKDVEGTSNGTVDAGAALTFSLVLHNDGSVAAADVTLVDPIQAPLVLVSAPGAVVDSGSVRWNVASLSSGGQQTFLAHVQVPASTVHGTEVLNQASASSPYTPDTLSGWKQTPQPDDPVRLTVTALPDFALFEKELVDVPDPVRPSDFLRYRLRLQNTGVSTAEQLVLSDAMPPELELLETTGGGVVHNQTVTWERAQLHPGEQWVVELTAQVQSDTSHGTVIANQASLQVAHLGETFVSTDPAVAGAAQPTSVTVSALPNLAGSMLHGEDLNGGTLEPGDKIRYTLQVRNNGHGAASAVLAQMAPPSYTNYIKGSTTLNGQPIADVGDAAPLVGGLLVQSATAGTAEGFIIANIDDPDATATVEFEVRVDPRAPAGTVLSAQGMISANEVGTVPTSNPATPSIPGDPTVMIVGGGAKLVALKLVENVTEPGATSARIGDVLRYTIRVANSGTVPAVQAVLEDPLPNQVSLQETSLRIDGVPTALSHMGISYDGSLLRVELPDIAPGADRTVEFETQVQSGPTVSNQAQLLYGGITTFSDGNPQAQGAQPTHMVVNTDMPHLGVYLTLLSEQGGVTNPGNHVRLVATVINEGTLGVSDVDLALLAGSQFLYESFEAGPQVQWIDDGAPAWRIGSLEPGQQEVLTLRAQLSADATLGEAIDVGLNARVGDASFDADPISIILGTGVGSATLSGRILLRVSEDNATTDPASDKPLEGFAVYVVPEGNMARAARDGVQGSDIAIANAVSRADGTYHISNLPQGRYQFWVISPAGVVFYRSDAVDIAGSQSRVQDLAIDPSGIIYQMQDGMVRPVAGARVFLVDYETGQDVERTAVLGGQQGQVTSAQGFYRFDVRTEVLPGRFYLRVEPPSKTMVFPAHTRPPVGYSDEQPLGAPASVGPDGRVVESSFPTANTEAVYFLRFDLDENSPQITNNHVPLDLLNEHIQIHKAVDRRAASVGEILTYTVTVANNSNQVIGTESEGVTIVDDLPPDMHWVAGSAWLETRVGGQLVVSRNLTEARQVSARVVHFGPFELQAQSTTSVRYQLVVGIRADGERVNRARMLVGDAVVSEDARASVRIRPDPIFTEGTVLGRVFCDLDGDGLQSAGEPGLPGARVFLDTGFYVDSDIAGKFHFRGVPPGRHMVKLDEQTLPPAVHPKGDTARLFYMSKGLLTKVSFPLDCRYAASRPDAVAVAEVDTEGRDQSVRFTLDPERPAVSLDGEAQLLPLVDAVLVQGDGAADFDNAAAQRSPDDKLVWHIKKPTRLAVERWEISIFDVSSQVEVYRVHGRGEPPQRVPWHDAAESPLERGRLYLYRLAVRAENGDVGEGRVRALQLVSETAAEEQIWRGELFDEPDTHTPTPLLKEHASTLAEELLRAPGNVEIEVHVPGGGNRTANLMLSQRRALAVRTLLVQGGVEAERIQARGMGDMHPLMPNITRVGREQNRRIIVRREVKQETERVEWQAAPIAQLWIHGKRQEWPSERSDVEVPVDAQRNLSVRLELPSGQRVRLHRSDESAAEASNHERSLQVPIAGDLHTGRLQIGPDDIGLQMLQAECNASAASYELIETGLIEPLRIDVRSPEPLARLTLRLFNPDGTILREFEGSGAESRFEFQGVNVQGHVLMRPGRYAYRCQFEDEAGNHAVSAQKYFDVTSADPEASITPLFEKTFAGALYPEGEALSSDIQAELQKVAAILRRQPAARVIVEAHADSSSDDARLRTDAIIALFQGYFHEHDIAPHQMEWHSHGASRPVMAGHTRRARDLNRRVNVRVVPVESYGGEGVLDSHQVRVGGVDMAVDRDQQFSGTVVIPDDTKVVVEVRLADGRSAMYYVPVVGGSVAVPSSASQPQFAVPTDAPSLGTVAPWTEEQAAPGAQAGPPPIAQPSGAPTRYEPSGPPPLQAASGPKSVHEPSGQAPQPMPSSGNPSQVEPSGPAPRMTPSGGYRYSEPSTTAAKSGASPAMDLEVVLPQDGSTLRGERLTVFGRCGSRNKVSINGKAVDLDEDGRFALTLVLPAGESMVQVLSEDDGGNVARIERRYIVPDGEWFAMGLADGIVGYGNRLEGMNEHTTIELPNQLYLHGRAVGYLKGRVKGSAILKNNPFDTIRVTAHVDSGKQVEQEILRQLIDPERYYPVYGDATEEVQDAASRYKAYVLIEADQSRFVVGNFQTQFTNLELFRYDRTFFGAGLDVKHEFVQGHTTEVHAVAASGDAGIRHRQLSLQGTGGSLYTLRDRELIEGSERVEVVVRDTITGGRLMSVPLTRDIGYRIDYREGRLILAQPVPSTVSGGWHLNQTPTRALEGHPVFIEVEYDFDAFHSTTRERAFAAQARHTVGDRFTLGAAAVEEDRTTEGAGKYRLVSGEARVRLVGQTRVDMEVAYSQSEDSQHWASFDGGITYGRLGMYRPETDGNGQPLAGFAGRLQISGDVADFVNALGNDGDDSQVAREFLPFTAFVQHQDPGFFSGGSVFEQGQTKVGGTARWQLSDKDGFRLRYDGAWSQIRAGEIERSIQRQIAMVGFEHQEENWKAGLEAGYNFFQAENDDPIHLGLITAYGERKLTPRLVGFAEQEALAGGDERMIHGTWDRFATSLGARYQLSERLWLTATETVRWNGTNSTQIGLKSQLTEDLSVYASERLMAGNRQGLLSTTVLGAENTAILGSRSYAEYQLDALSSGRSGRAVFGMDNHWTLIDGLTLNLSYERSQRLGTPSQVFAQPTGFAIDDPRVAGAAAGTLNAQQQFAASGYNSAGMFPVGVASRDAFAIGLEYLRSKTLKAGARFEMRYDKVDARQDMSFIGNNDRLVFFGNAGGDWRFERNFVLLGRVQGASIHNLDVDVGGEPAIEAQFMDVSLGLALRPAESDRFEALLKWTRRYDRRAINVERTLYQLQTADVLAFEPALEVGWGFQIVGKVAMKFFQVVDAQLPQVMSTTYLALLRLNYHLTDMFDVAAEYRVLGNTLTEEAEHGALFEVAWVPSRYVSVGVGYNFTHFSDNLLDEPLLDPHGFFLRVTGKY